MADEHLLKLLEEIRDLQKQQREFQASDSQPTARNRDSETGGSQGEDCADLSRSDCARHLFSPGILVDAGLGSEVRTATLALKGHLVSSCSNAMF